MTNSSTRIPRCEVVGLCEAIFAENPDLPVFGTRVLGGVPVRAPDPDPGCGTACPRSCSPSSTASCRPPSPGVIGAYTPLIARALEVSVPTVKPRVLWRLVYLVPVVAGCDCSWRWRSGAQAASCSAGRSHADGGVRANGVEPVHPLGGGEHGRRRCPPKGPGYGSARPCIRSSEPRPGQSRKESPLEPTEATASHSDRAAP